VLLEDQDRSLWNRALIEEGEALVERALTSRRFGPYTLQAAIVALHADTSSSAETDWGQIVALYDVLARTDPSPVIELNRAVAVAMRDGPEAGLALIEAIFARGDLDQYQPAHAARADLYRRLGHTKKPGDPTGAPSSSRSRGRSDVSSKAASQGSGRRRRNRTRQAGAGGRTGAAPQGPRSSGRPYGRPGQGIEASVIRSQRACVTINVR
jgi:hypothetical protein